MCGLLGKSKINPFSHQNTMKIKYQNSMQIFHIIKTDRINLASGLIFLNYILNIHNRNKNSQNGCKFSISKYHHVIMELSSENNQTLKKYKKNYHLCCLMILLPKLSIRVLKYRSSIIFGLEIRVYLLNIKNFSTIATKQDY